MVDAIARLAAAAHARPQRHKVHAHRAQRGHLRRGGHKERAPHVRNGRVQVEQREVHHAVRAAAVVVRGALFRAHADHHVDAKVSPHRRKKWEQRVKRKVPVHVVGHLLGGITLRC